ncbi:2-oxoacid ferredoxin oxidoreductase [bacterium]|nr:2-oxoacid ferredoxin oxidoreductase [bacterium]
MTTLKDYDSIKTAWCPGCGNFGILNALKQSLASLDKKPHEVLICSGIGQAAKLPHYLRCHVFNGLHGRTLPVATGAKLANHRLLVIAIGGDGDMYGEGGNHFLHAIRKNLDITLLVNNNKVYGLTKGQASPTTDIGIKTKVQPDGVVAHPLNPLALAISQHCSFVARGFSGERTHLMALLQAALAHKGFSYIDILQPCVSFNKVNTHAWYKERVYPLAAEKDFDKHDAPQALQKAGEWGDRIPIGILYQSQPDSYTDHIPQLQSQTLVEQTLVPPEFSSILNSYHA